MTGRQSTIEITTEIVDAYQLLSVEILTVLFLIHQCQILKVKKTLEECMRARDTLFIFFSTSLLSLACLQQLIAVFSNS